MMERKRKALEETWLREQQQIHHLQVSSCLLHVKRKGAPEVGVGEGMSGEREEGIGRGSEMRQLRQTDIQSTRRRQMSKRVQERG
jgi:hypothetical protein